MSVVWNRRGEPIQHREQPLPVSTFQDVDGQWLPDDQWPYISAVLVCTNSQCSFAGQEVPAQLGENIDGQYRSHCGVCGCETSRYHLLMDCDLVIT